MNKINIPISFFIIILLISCAPLKEIPETADDFFQKVKEAKYDDAYELVSEEFKNNTSLEELIDFLEGSTLADFKSANWSSRKYDNNEGELKGDITTESGGTIPITIKFVKEQDKWKILSIYKESGGIELQTELGKSIPNENNLKKMASEAVLQLAKAINTEDFKPFYNYVCAVWKKETTPDELKKAFQEFIDKEIDLEVVKEVEIVISDEPTLEDDVLAYSGYFTTSPHQVYYSVTYFYEYPKWKLAGITINVR